MICRFMAMKMVLVFGLVVICSAPVPAEENVNASVRRSNSVGVAQEDWNMQMSLGHLPSADIHGTPGNVSITDYRIKLARNIKLDDRLILTWGGGYGFKHIDSSSVPLPQDLHGLYIEAGARYRINDRSFASIKLYPGFYSDFKYLDVDDLRMPVLALGGYSFDNGFSIVGGFVYRFGYHSSQFIPALGFSYQPGQYWRFDLIAPRPGITYLASRQLQLFVAGDFTSDEYELKERSLGAKAIKYSDYKAMIGINYLPIPAVKLSTSIGYAFEREFVFFNGNRPDMRVDDIPFLKMSLDVGW